MGYLRYLQFQNCFLEMFFLGIHGTHGQILGRYMEKELLKDFRRMLDDENFLVFWFLEKLVKTPLARRDQILSRKSALT